MRLQRQLNIDNTYRVLNLNLEKIMWDKLIRVVPENKDQVLQTLKEDNGKDYTYLVDRDKSMDLLLNHKVFRSDGHLIYYSEGLIPTAVFTDIGTNRNSIYLYKYQEFSRSLVQNISKASIVGTTAIYLKDVPADLNTTKLIFALNDVRFIADRLYLDFKPEVTKEDKEAIFDQLHEILARWTIQLFLGWNDEAERDALKQEIVTKYK